jgi:elongation factor 1-beta
VTIYKAVSKAPDAEKYPNAARWYKHIHSYENDFTGLPGDTSADASVYGPDATTSAAHPAAAPDAEEEDEDVDLFGSSDEEEDEEKAAQTKKRLEEYAAKKAGKPKPGMSFSKGLIWRWY